MLIDVKRRCLIAHAFFLTFYWIRTWDHRKPPQTYYNMLLILSVYLVMHIISVAYIPVDAFILNMLAHDPYILSSPKFKKKATWPLILLVFYLESDRKLFSYPALDSIINHSLNI